MFPALQAHAQPSILRIWQEAHDVDKIDIASDIIFLKYSYYFYANAITSSNHVCFPLRKYAVLWLYVLMDQVSS